MMFDAVSGANQPIDFLDHQFLKTSGDVASCLNSVAPLILVEEQGQGVGRLISCQFWMRPQCVDKASREMSAKDPAIDRNLETANGQTFVTIRCGLEGGAKITVIVSALVRD